MEKRLFMEMEEIEREHWWFVGRRQVIKDIMQRFMKYPVERTLDIGCGTGYNALWLSAFTKKIDGVEKENLAIKIAKKTNPRLKIIKGTFPNIDLKEKYNLVTAFDVLEHIVEHNKAIKSIDKILAKNGVAILTVPAISLLWSEHDEYFGHVRRYTKETLKNLITDNTTLRIEMITYFNFYFFFPSLIWRLLKRFFSLKTGRDDFYSFPYPLNNIFASLFSSEKLLLRNFNLPIGLSLICLLRKAE